MEPDTMPEGTQDTQANEPAPATEQSQQQSEQVVTQPKAKKKLFSGLSHRTKLLVLVGGMLVILIVITAVLLLGKKDTKENLAADTTNNSSKTEQTETADTSEKQVADQTTLTNNTLLSAPKKIEDLKLVKPDAPIVGGDYASAAYYQIGTTEKGKRIVVFYYDTGTIEGAFTFLFVEEDSTRYVMSDQLMPSYDGIKENFTDIVELSPTLRISELNYPKETTVAGQKLKTVYSYPSFSPEGVMASISNVEAPKKLGDVSAYTLYRTVHKNEPNYQIIELHAVLGNMFQLRYDLNGELSSTSEDLPITWTSGENKPVKAYSGGAGCGSSGYVISAVNKATLIQVGTSKAGQKVYQLPATSALAKELYEKDYLPNADFMEGEFKNMSMETFTSKHSYFLVENGYAEYVVFQHNSVFVRGGCAKPVVYLYPTQTTTVSVLVGADVVISEPQYEANGWQNVIAEPSGVLTYRGKTYDSLFWEGYGHGEYPEITEGTIVAQKDAASTMRAQLAAQGFNAKETQDFMTYWEPKLPKTPYVRLTWLGTAATNRLAPLTITPAPQTLIRTFLDFEGVEAPYALKPQTFRAQARNGFTVTEWGGLLRQGIR
jgi:hypothetical protein